MKSLTESILNKRYNPNIIINGLEKTLNDTGEIERLAKKYNIPFNTMRDIFNRIKDEISGYSSDDQEKWLDDFLEHHDANISDECLDNIAKESGKRRKEIDDIIEDISYLLYDRFK